MSKKLSIYDFNNETELLELSKYDLVDLCILYQEKLKQFKDQQKKLDLLTYIIDELDYLDTWNNYNTSELLEIIKGEEDEE